MFQSGQELTRVADLFGDPLVYIARIGGGRNSRVYKILLGTGEEFAVKQYYADGNGECERMMREFRTLEFLWGSGIRSVPRPVKIDYKGCQGVYEFVRGSIPNTDSLDREDINQAVKFLIGLHRLSSASGGKEQPWASEAFVSLTTIVDGIGQRLSRLIEGSRSSSVFSEVSFFLNSVFTPVFNQIVGDVGRQVGESPEIVGGTVTLSPSDFGFHNVLRKGDGQLTFVDFEHFGYDDPVKLVADISLHPHSAMQFDDRLKRSLITSLSEYFGSFDQFFSERLSLFWPIFCLKWCMILLNEFDTEALARRKHALAGREYFVARAPEIQLEKARKMLDKVEKCDSIVSSLNKKVSGFGSTFHGN